MSQHLYYATLACPLNATEIFLRLRQQSGCIWLDSARSNPQGDARYSLIAANPTSRLRFRAGRLEQTDYTYTAGTNKVVQTLSTPVLADPLLALGQWLAQLGRTTENCTATANAAKELATQPTAPSPSVASALGFFRGGAVGYFSYEFGRQWEKYTPLRAVTTGFPQMDWALYDCAVVCDHQAGTAHVVACSPQHPDAAQEKAEALLHLLQQMPAAVNTPAEPPPARKGKASTTACHVHKTPAESIPRKPSSDTNASDSARASAARSAAYMRSVEQTRAYIAQGDIYQTNIAQHFSASLHEAPADLYLRLRELNPAPYAAYLDTGDFQILSSSPELFLQKRGQRILTRPIKGTRPRGQNADEDARLRQELVQSEKERAELLMIVDLERNDLGRVCEPGSVSVESLYRVETYATVHHLMADVSGVLKTGTTLSDLLRATFPGGSITGAPKVRAMEIIDELEGRERGIFCGAIGMLGADGSVDLNIAIRTLLCAPTAEGALVHASVGAGLVWDSDPRLEYEETLHKAEALLKVINTQCAPRFI